jgi:hypothetical protein
LPIFDLKTSSNWGRSQIANQKSQIKNDQWA